MVSAVAQLDRQAASNFVPMSITLFYPPARMAVDTYLLSSAGQKAVHYASATHPPDRAALDRLVASGVNCLYIPCGQVKAFREQLSQLCQQSESMPTAMRLAAAKEEAKSNFANAWRKSEVDALVQNATALSEGVLEACQASGGLMGELMHLLHHDGDTFAHITNVCTYSLLLAQRLGISDRKILLEVGTAALLHDVGKRQISADILRKPGKLTAGERRTIADHPRLGFIELNQRPDLSWSQLLMVYQHHEREDGSGYPVGIDGSEIHWMAKLCAVVDVFDALTARRPYRDSASAAEVLEHLTEEAPLKMDEEMVKCWKSIVEKGISART